MKKCVWIPEELHRAAKLAATDARLSLEGLIAGALQDYLAKLRKAGGAK